jgi:hypothetical protein
MMCASANFRFRKAKVFNKVKQEVLHMLGTRTTEKPSALFGNSLQDKKVINSLKLGF